MPKQSSYSNFIPIANDLISGTDDPGGTPTHGNIEINAALADLLAGLISNTNAANYLLRLNGSGLVSVSLLPDSDESQKGIIRMASDGGTEADRAVTGDDSRLSDARTPTSHTHLKSEITDLDLVAAVDTAFVDWGRNSDNWHMGYYKNQAERGISSDGTGFPRVRDGVFQLVTAKYGIVSFDLQMAVNLDKSEPDVEIRLPDGNVISVLDGSSDRKGANSHSMIYMYKNMDMGCYPMVYDRAEPRTL